MRLALGETHVIADTKRALAEGGVDIDLLERAAASNRKKHDLPRSGSVMLVKNLPYEVTKTELTLMFEKFGARGAGRWKPRAGRAPATESTGTSAGIVGQGMGNVCLTTVVGSVEGAACL